MVDQNRMMVAFIFDSGRLESNSYGEVVFEHILLSFLLKIVK